MAPPKLSAKLQRNQTELRRSRKWRDTEDMDDMWKRMVDLYRGRHYAAASPDDRMIINIAFATKNVIAPSVAVSNPRFSVQARKPESAAHAVVTEEILNYVWRTHKYQSEFRLAVDDFLTIGHGWLKVGYKFVKEPVVKAADPKDESGDDEDGVDDRDETKEGNVESESRITDDRPYCERVSPFDIYVDPDARSVKELRWIAQRVRRQVADVKVDKRYEASARKLVQPQSGSRWEEDGPHNDSSGGADQVGYCDIFEFYDLRTKEVCTFAANVDEFLIKPKKMPYAFGHPFVMLRNYEVPDLFYPMGELEAIEGLQLELNETRTQMMNHRKRFARKFLYDEDAFDENGIAALKSDVDNTMIPVLKSNGSLTDSVVPMPAVVTPPEFYNQSDMISGDIDRISGVSDYMRGNMPNIRRTATEAAMLQDAQNARAADKLARIEDILSQVGARLIQLMQQFLTGEQSIRIVGTSREPVWVNYDKDWIQGDFDFEVEGGSTQPRNESFRRQSAIQLVEAMAPFIGSGVVNPMMVARHVLQNFGVQNPDGFLAEGGGMPPPEGAGPAGQPPAGPQGPMGEPEEPESPISGIPANLLGQLNVDPAPQNRPF